MQVGNINIVGASPFQRAVLKARGIFVENYCKEKGWPVDFVSLSFEQIMEIRSQDGWKNPESNKPLVCDHQGGAASENPVSHGPGGPTT